MIAGDWTDPLVLVLLGGVLLVVGVSWRGSRGPLAPGAGGIAVDKEQPTGGAVGRTYLATERVLPFASPMKNRFATKRLAAIVKKGIVRFRLRAVRRDSSEAWYQEAGRIPSGDVP